MNPQRKIYLYNSIIVLLLVGLVILGIQSFKLKQTLNEMKTDPIGLSSKINSIPYYEKVMNIIRPLRYSGLEALSRNDVRLSIDFNNNSWTIHNLHKYDNAGNIILEDSRNGLCGELGSYVYNKIKPLFGDQYDIKFVRVAESGFFLSPKSTHSILLIQNKTTKETYLLDPSFYRYGLMDDFDEYMYFEYSDTIIGVNNKETDVQFQAGQGTPITIHNDFITYLAIESVDGVFNKDNFIISIRANRRYKYTGRYVFAIRKVNGEMEAFEGKWLENQALEAEEIEQLKKIVSGWFLRLG